MSRLKTAGLGAFIIGIVMIMIVPLPTFFMDFLLMLNIAFSILILLDAVYSREPLDMSMFPTLLLVSTLFSLALSVSTTRLILGQGYAGAVIAAFGEFVAGGDLVVGVIIFVILVIVNFMVITKGSERVAEVTARFTLDAMPGKQMAIDADLNTGLIDEKQARERRKKISDEANFYGAMDGASKFVKGNAIAGILITFVNIIGGIAIGVTSMGLSAGEAAQVYTLMTIGDGLVAQIPALLISTATGVLVTKATNDEDITVTVIRQVLSQPRVLYITGVVLFLLGFTPLPFYFFMPFGLFLVFLGRQMEQKEEKAKVEGELSAEDETLEEIRKPENVITLLNVDSVVLLFGYGLIPLVEAKQGGDLIDRIIMIRRQIALELGVIIPMLRVRDDIKLNPNEYKISIKGNVVAGGEIMFDHYMAMNPGFVEDEIDGIETREPYLGLPALWIPEESRERAEALGYTVVDAPAIIATHMTEIVRRHLHEILTRQDVQTLVNNVKETHPILVEELIPRQLSIGEVQKVIGNLLRESVSVRDLVTILEILADYSTITKDTDVLTEYVRQGLKRSISSKFLGDSVNKVITLDPVLEQKIMAGVTQTEFGGYAVLSPEDMKKMNESLRKESQKLVEIGIMPMVLTAPGVRGYFKKLAESVVDGLIVIAYGEVDAGVEIESVGMVTAET